MARLRDAVRRNWTARPAAGTSQSDAPGLVLLPLEERRVLSASAALALAQAVAPSGMEQVEGTAQTPEPATPLGTDAARQEPIDPGNRTVQGEGQSSTAEHDDAEGPAAENLTESENRSAGPAESDVDTPVATPAQSSQIELEVAGDQEVDEGSPLDIEDIGTFVDHFPFDRMYDYTIDWGDGHTSSGTATIDDPGGDGQPLFGSFDGSHVYADNGDYTVTITLRSLGDDITVSDTLLVTVYNVDPTLTPADDITVDEGEAFEIIDIGMVSDPGFDDEANDSVETFTYSISWGDGTATEFGVVTIDQTGGEGMPTLGSFDGSHTYVDNGTYVVTLNVFDDDGGMATATLTVTVNNVAPTPVIEGADSIDEGSEYSIDVTFTDPGGDDPEVDTSESFTYTISWGDGTATEVGVPTETSLPRGPSSGFFSGSHTYVDNGTYTITVTVTDDDGGVGVATLRLTVNNVDPTPVIEGADSIDEGSVYSIDVTFTDPGGDDPEVDTSESFTYTINWGDGTATEVGVPTETSLPRGPSSGFFSGSHTYVDNGTYTITVTVTDDDGGVGVATLRLTVNNVDPTPVIEGADSIDEGSEYSIDVTFTDPGGDDPEVDTSESFTYTINWGDGTATEVGVPTETSLPRGPSSGFFSGSHTYVDNGTYTITVTVTDDDGGVGVATLVLTVNNVDPTPVIEGADSIDEGSEYSIDVTFTDPGGDDPEVDTSESFTYTINWGDGTATLVGVPTETSLPRGPSSGFFGASHTYADNGTYTITVTVTDDDGGVGVSTLELRVDNVAPTLVVPADQTVEAGEVLSLPDIGQFSDPGFDNPDNPGPEKFETFTYTIDWGDGSPLDGGDATIDRHGSAGVTTLGSFDGEHIYAEAGVYRVKVTVFDDDDGSDMKEFFVTVVVTPLSLFAGEAPPVSEGAVLSVIDIGRFLDQHGRAESYSYQIDWGDGRGIDHGLATIDGFGIEGQFTHGSFDGTHIYADNGHYVVTLTLTASDGRTASTQVTVAVDNVAPVLITVGNQEVPLGTNLPLPNIGAFTDPGFNNAANPGPDRMETFTYTIDWGDGQTSTGDARVDRLGGPMVLTAGTFDGAHVYGTPGIFSVEVTIVDDNGGVSTANFEITVTFFREGGFGFPPGGGGGPAAVPDAMPAPAAPVPAPFALAREELPRLRSGGVTGAETRLVLRIVSPDGVEDKEHDELLSDEVLDDLRGFFKRLPPKHYRIYLIQPDGVERLVVDNFEFDEQYEEPAPPPAVREQVQPPAEVPPSPDAATNEVEEAIETLNAAPADAAPAPEPAPPVEKLSQDPSSEAAAFALGGGLGTLVPTARRARLRAGAGRRGGPPPLDKRSRLLRKAR